MKRLASLVLLELIAAASAVARAELVEYSGMADASAGVALDHRYFAAAGDEEVGLFVYDRTRPGGPGRTLDLAGPLRIPGREVDVEGAARIGARIFWISSHGRNKDGEHQPWRHRLFATDVLPASNEPPVLCLSGRAVEDLALAIARAPAHAELGFGVALGLGPDGRFLPSAPELAPKRNGFNLEGLAAGPAGELWIGLRNPLDHGRALILRLLNPDEVVDRGRPPRFAPPLRLDLGGQAIRSLERAGTNEWLVVAGSVRGSDAFRRWRWTFGGAGKLDARDAPWPAADFRAEAAFAWPDGVWTYLSDDGDRPAGAGAAGMVMKDLKDRSARRFRAWTEGMPAASE